MLLIMDGKNEVHVNLLQDVGEYVNEAAISALMNWMKDAGLPEVKAFCGEYVHALSEHGEKESGWNKFRDRVFIPSVINGALWLAENVLNRIIKETEVKANA